MKSATIEGEAVVCAENGVSDFEKLHSRSHDHTAIFYAFDLLEIDGEDLRPLALEDRKARLGTLLRRAPNGIHLLEHETGDGSKIFAAACKLGLEGIVSKVRQSVEFAHYTQRILNVFQAQGILQE